MAHEIVMPRVDMDMTQGRMGRWHAREGAAVVRGSPLFEIETDKAAMEVEAPASGVLRFVTAGEGDVLPVGACIAWIVGEDEAFSPPAAGAAPLVAATAASAHAVAESSAPRLAEPAAFGLRATPAARRLARERGVKLGSVRGTGPRGRIQARDLVDHAAVDSRSRGASASSGQGAGALTGYDSVQTEPALLAGTSGSRVHREWLGRGGGAPIVFIHGFCADLNGWRPLFRHLPEARPALAIDLPGHGQSRLGDGATFETLVEAARAALAEEGIVEAHFVGHSLGGAVAAALSAGPSIKTLSLMLIAPAGLGFETNAAFFEGFLDADTEASLAPWLNLLVTDPASLGEAMAAATIRQRAEAPIVAEQRRLAATLFVNGRQAIDVRDALATPACPVKVVFGEEDRLTPVHHTESLSGLIAVHRFARVGHMPHFEARREVARLVEELVRAGSTRERE